MTGTRTLSAALATLAAITLTACEAADNQPGRGGLTIGEERAMDEAAAIIDERNGIEPGSAAQQTGANAASASETDEAETAE